MDRHRRPGSMPRGVRVLGVLAVALVTAVSIAPASPAAAPAPATVSASTASDAQGASREARLLRRDTADLLAGYLTQYGDRFTAEENATLIGYKADADRTLAGVVVTTKRLQSLIAAGASRSEVIAAGRAALRAHARARAAAHTSYDGARRIMEPRLSLFEGIAAIREYDAMLARFDDLGGRIESVVAAVRR